MIPKIKFRTQFKIKIKIKIKIQIKDLLRPCMPIWSDSQWLRLRGGGHRA